MIHLDVDYKAIEAARTGLKNIPFGFARARKMAMKRSLEAMRTEAVRKAREVYYVKAGAVRNAITLIPGRGDSAGLLMVQGKRLSLSEFYMSPRKRPKRQKGLNVMVKREGGVKHIPKAFLIPVKSGGKYLPYIRTGKGRMDIKHLMSPAIPQMIGNYEVSEQIIERGEEVFMKTFDFWAKKAVRDWQTLASLTPGHRPDYLSGEHISLPGAKGSDVTGWH